MTVQMQLEEMRKNEDPRLSFSTPDFKEAQQMFSDSFKVLLMLSLMCMSVLVLFSIMSTAPASCVQTLCS